MKTNKRCGHSRRQPTTQPVTQEHPSGCAVACVASLLGISYRRALSLFSHPEFALLRGHYCKEICEALERGGLPSTYAKVTAKTKHLLNKSGTICFIKRDKRCPLGHFLLKTEQGWMNPWINHPSITPAKSGLQKKLPGKAQWVVFSSNA